MIDSRDAALLLQQDAGLLPDAAVQEAKDRVRSAIQNSGFPDTKSRITVNLAPAGLQRKPRLTRHGDRPTHCYTRSVKPADPALYYRLLVAHGTS